MCVFFPKKEVVTSLHQVHSFDQENNMLISSSLTRTLKIQCRRNDGYESMLTCIIATRLYIMKEGDMVRYDYVTYWESHPVLKDKIRGLLGKKESSIEWEYQKPKKGTGREGEREPKCTYCVVGNVEQ